LGLEYLRLNQDLTHRQKFIRVYFNPMIKNY